MCGTPAFPEPECSTGRSLLCHYDTMAIEGHLSTAFSTDVTWKSFALKCWRYEGFWQPPSGSLLLVTESL